MQNKEEVNVRVEENHPTCKFCGKPAYKTNSQSEWICKRKAETGSCYPRENFTSSNGTLVRKNRKIGRNEICPCGSGLKFKRCHGKRN